MNLSESLLHACRDHGARQVFGIPGDFAIQFFRVIEESGILPLYTLSHEPSVGYAADAAARLLSAPSVAAVTYGAGALNMTNAVAAAYAEKSPLVVVSGAPGAGESRSGLLLHHQVKTHDSQLAIYREITCDHARLDDLRRAPADIARVLGSCLTQSRPVYFELPRDLVFEDCERAARLPGPRFNAEAVAACVEEILGRIGRARRPVVMVGVEVRRFGLEARVARLAECLGLPVVTSFMGRGLLADSPGVCHGPYLGFAGDPHTRELVEEADCLLLLGVIQSDTNFGVSADRIRLQGVISARDRMVSMGHHSYSNLPLAALVDALIASSVDRAPQLCALPREFPCGLEADEEALTPQDVARGVNDLFASHGRMPLACDVGDCLFASMDIVNTDFVAPGYYATMGFGVPAGLGVQAATGRRPVILVGDGAFQMTGWELGNCRRYGWDPIVIVLNNLGWEMLRVFQPESRFNDLGDWRFAELAGPLGGDGMRVTTRAGLKAALAAANAKKGRFQLIEVMLEPGQVSPTLGRFVEALKANTRRANGS